MGTAVSGSTLNPSTSNAAANPDTSRNAASGALGLSFSELLRGQIQSGADTRTPEPIQQADTRPAPAPTRTPPPSSPETSRPSQPTRESGRTNGQNTETGQSVKQQTETQDAPLLNRQARKPVKPREPVKPRKAAKKKQLPETSHQTNALSNPNSRMPRFRRSYRQRLPLC